MSNISTISICFILTVMSCLSSQSSTRGDFSRMKDLQDVHKLHNIKSGNIVTGIRNDTLFGVFYSVILNRFEILPLCNLKSENMFSYSGDNMVWSWNQSLTTSRLQSEAYSAIGSETVYIISQKSYLGAHRPRHIEEKYCYLSRLLYYRKSSGILLIEELNNSENCDTLIIQDSHRPSWLYVKGDFLID